jgi:hypothetical protein
MPYIISEPFIGGPYTGPICNVARVLPGRYYANKSDAMGDAAKLDSVSLSGWDVIEVQTSRSIKEAYPWLDISDRAGETHCDMRLETSPDVTLNIIEALADLHPPRPIHLCHGGNWYYFADANDLNQFYSGFQLRHTTSPGLKPD